MSHCYQQLTLVDRRPFHHLVERKVPINEMARQLGRHRLTIYRILPQFVWCRGSIRAFSSSGPALPYIARLRVLMSFGS
jgi:hypothetical protein